MVLFSLEELVSLMRPMRLTAFSFVVAMVSSTIPGTHAASQAPPSSAGASSSAASRHALLKQYCFTCHNARLRTGGLDFGSLDVEQVGRDAKIWEQVVRKLRAGAMPPPARPRPDKVASDEFATWLESELDRTAVARPNPGRTEALHRLNRAEYRNAVRDLLALDLDVSSILPPDDASYGFDNVAGVLRVSSTLLESYLSAARHISRLAVGTRSSVVTADTFRVPSDLPQTDRDEQLPFGTRGGTAIRYYFPVPAEYDIKIELARGFLDTIAGLAEPNDIEVSVDGERVRLFTVGGKQPRAEASRGDGNAGPPRAAADAGLQVRVPVQAGSHTVGVAFVQKSAAQLESLRLPFLRPGVERGDTGGQPYIGSVTITGPHGGTSATDTPSRRRIFMCRPADGAGEMPCVKRILSSLALRAYRGLMTDADLEILLSFYGQGKSEGGVDSGIEVALQRMLVDPKFLFRVERDPPNIAPDTAYQLPDVELASRLSFFLWSSIPDDELQDLARKGTLNTPAVLAAQVRRMLADARSHALVSNFAGQWLYLRNVRAVSPDRRLFPDFDESLRRAFQTETELFFESIVREDRSILDLLRADYTFVNERLARHYGIPHVYGTHFRRVSVGGGVRGGLLGQGSILTVTSSPTRTSPVSRGKWILENLIGTPPPEPPPNVPGLAETNPNEHGKVLSMRERMAQHRSDARCASCHSVMDPLGLSLENFDAVGRWRSDEGGTPIDASGAFPDGSVFQGPAGLKGALLNNPDAFVGTMIEKLLVYALGRGVEHYDAPWVRAIRRSAARDDYRFSQIVTGIVTSVPFRMRRSQS
jgi:hypothetical protein